MDHNIPTACGWYWLKMDGAIPEVVEVDWDYTHKMFVVRGCGGIRDRLLADYALNAHKWGVVFSDRIFNPWGDDEERGDNETD